MGLPISSERAIRLLSIETERKRCAIAPKSKRSVQSAQVSTAKIIGHDQEIVAQAQVVAHMSEGYLSEMLKLVSMFSGNAKERKRQRALCVAEDVDNADITKAGKVLAAFGDDIDAIVKEYSRLNVAYKAACQELGTDNRGSHGNHKKAGGDDRREFLGMTKKQQQAEIAKAQARINWMIKNSK